MRWFLFLPIVYLAAVLQTSLVEVIRIGRVEPDLLAMTAVIWVLVSAGSYDFLAAGLIGLLVDLMSPGRLGVGAGCYLVVGYALTGFRASGKEQSLAPQLLAVWAAVTLLALGQTLGRWLLGDEVAVLSPCLGRAMGVGLYTAVAAAAPLVALRWVHWRRPRRQRALDDF